MFFGKNNNNGGVNVNTSFYTSYSNESLLTVGGWNRNLSIKLAPSTGKDTNGLTQYTQDQNQIINTSIREENAIALLEGYNEVILPAIKEKKDAKITISIGSGDTKKALSIMYKDGNAILELCTNINESGVTDESHVYTHTFNKKGYAVDYKWEDGTAEVVDTEADLINFMKKIEKMQDLVPTTAHSIKYSEANKAAYKNNNQNNNDYQSNYSAPSNTFNGSDMGDFLPYS